jgi:hypothetical protein
VSPNILGLNEAAARGSRIKWLICADCDLGPLGWSYEGGSEAWIAADRLRYSPLAFDAVASDSNTEKV